MKPLIAASEYYLVNQILKNGSLPIGKSKAGEELNVFSGIFALAGSGLCLGSIYFWADKTYTPDVAFGLTGAASLGVAAVIAGISYGLYIRRQLKFLKLKNEIMAAVHSAIDKADEEFSQPIKEHPKTSVSLALLIGYLAGEKIL